MTLGFAMFVATFMVAVVAAIMAVCYALVWLLYDHPHSSCSNYRFYDVDACCGSDLQSRRCAVIEVEQLSLFTMLSPVPPAVAVCCMDGSRVDATPAESWMQRLVQGGEYVVQVASHPMVLRPADGTADDVPAGHRYYHYTIGERLFSGVFVGRERVRT